MTYKAAIFDLDGTLVDSLADLADATNYALTSFKQPVHAIEAYKLMIGDGIQTLISRSLGQDKQHLIEQVLAKMREKYLQICLNKTRPYKGIPEVINELAKRGVKLAVLTNKDQKMAQQIVSHFFDGLFQIVKGTMAAVPVKPLPFDALQILEEFNVGRQETIFVGDSNIDIQTAKSAGIKAVGVSWGFRGKKELMEAGAKTIMDEANQLLAFFK